MRAGSDAGCPRRHLAIVGFEPGDQLRQIFCRNTVLGNDHHRVACDLGNRFKVLHQIKIQRIDRAIDHMRSEMADAQRVAIRCRMHGAANADRSACPGHVLNQDWLSQRLAHAFPKDARQCVGWTAGRRRAQ